MKEKSRWYLLSLLILPILGYSLYRLGYHTGEENSRERFINNSVMIRRIAELASLEVSGNLQYQYSNSSSNNSWMSAFHDALFEQSVFIQIPYTAKYGCSLGSDSLTLHESKTAIQLELPPVQLLSLELHLNRIRAGQKSGWFITNEEELYVQAEKKLYSQARTDLSQNSLYIQKAENNLKEIYLLYFRPSNKNILISFSSTKAIRPTF